MQLGSTSDAGSYQYSLVTTTPKIKINHYFRITFFSNDSKHHLCYYFNHGAYRDISVGSLCLSTSCSTKYSGNGVCPYCYSVRGGCKSVTFNMIIRVPESYITVGQPLEIWGRASNAGGGGSKSYWTNIVGYY